MTNNLKIKTMDFKGTKGKWDFGQKHTDQVKGTISVYSNGDWLATMANSDEKSKYDALLISKAPEMLKFLQELSNSPKELNGVYWIQKAQELLKEATTI